MIIAGHGRILAARKLGLAEVPVMVAEGWTEPQKRAYVLADNQLALNAGWDMDLLSNELADLQAQGFDLGLTGFSDIDALLAGRGTAGLTDPDAVPEPGARAVATLGDVWLLGGHRLVCGDSTDAAAVGACLGQERPHLMVTDPPYGVEYDPGWRDEAAKRSPSMGNRKDTAKGKVENDDKADWREAWALFPGDVAYVWHAMRKAGTVYESLEAAEFEIRAEIVWAKSHLVISQGHYHPQHESCWYAVRKRAGATGHWHGDRKQTTLWQIPKPAKSETGHGTQKPVECMRRPMENNSVAGNAVYEPFSGSGTTIIAGEQCARRVLAIELNPIYVDVAIKRWQQFTGKLATLESTGQSFEDVADARYDWRKDGFESWEVWCAAKRDELVKAGKAA
jgi:DNA modification methylase